MPQKDLQLTLTYSNSYIGPVAPIVTTAKFAMLPPPGGGSPVPSWITGCVHQAADGSLTNAYYTWLLQCGNKPYISGYSDSACTSFLAAEFLQSCWVGQPVACSPFKAEWDYSAGTCGAIPAAFLDTATYLDSSPVSSPPGLMCQIICITGGGVPVAGASVSVTGGSSGTTNSSGCVYLFWQGAPGAYPIHVTAAGHPSFSGTLTLACNGTTDIELGSMAVARVSGATTFPTVREQAHNLRQSLRGFVASGLALAPKTERARRQSICQACPKYVDGRCTACGCFVTAKVWVASDRCPLDPPKWEAVAGGR